MTRDERILVAVAGTLKLVKSGKLSASKFAAHVADAIHDELHDISADEVIRVCAERIGEQVEKAGKTKGKPAGKRK